MWPFFLRLLSQSPLPSNRQTSTTLVMQTLLLTSCIVAGSSPLASAQILPDQTLGSEGSVVVPNVTIRGAQGDLIDGGAIRATVLFHSFSDFNINDFERVYFSSPGGIEHILSRVTGNDISNIFGTLGVDGDANLFFLNPNGIVFGENARLDISGSFIATTADAFQFADGQVFSAVNPEAPPLLTINLTPGLQDGNYDFNFQDDGGQIINRGQLVVGDTLTLDGDRLTLTGTLQAERNLRLRAQDTVEIRDTPTTPFLAAAGRNLRIRGRESIDIFALNHPESGLVAGRDLVLRSGDGAIADAHFAAGRDFRVERISSLGRRLGPLLSEDDPVIRASGDVEFQAYEGASLHILAGGQVRVPGTITITGADTLGNSLQEAVTLSDGETVVAIDGSAEPTLDIRAGMADVGLPSITNPESFPDLIVGATGTNANIQVGSISNPGGTVFLTNQYQPNLGLQGGDIQVGAIDTAISQFDGAIARGGNVVIDARNGVQVEADIITTAFADGGTDTRAFGGDITILAGDTIDAFFLDTSASATANAGEQRSIQPDGTERVEMGSASAIAQGGSITLRTRVDRASQSVSESVGNISTTDINTSATSFVNASAPLYSPYGGGSYIGEAIAGNATTVSRGGTITLSTDVRTGDIVAQSDGDRTQIGTIQTGELRSSAYVTALANATADVNVSPSFYYPTDINNTINAGNATGGTVSDVVNRSGTIRLSTDVSTGDIIAGADIGTLRTAGIDASGRVAVRAYASARVNVDSFSYVNVNNQGSGGIATGGRIQNIEHRGGAIALNTEVQSGQIDAESDIGLLRAEGELLYGNYDRPITTYAFSAVDANADASVHVNTRGDTTVNTGNGGVATGGSITDVSIQAGAITLSTQSETGTISAFADIATLGVTPLNASAYGIDAAARFNGFSARANVYAGGVQVENTGNGGTATGTGVNGVTVESGAVTLSTEATTGDLAIEAMIGNINTINRGTIVRQRRSANIRSQATANVNARATASIEVAAEGDIDRNVGLTNSGNGGETTGGSVANVAAQGRGITAATNVTMTNILPRAGLVIVPPIGIVRAGTIRSEVDVSTTSDAISSILTRSSFFGTAESAPTQNDGQAGAANGASSRNISGRGGPITLSTAVTTGDIASDVTVGILQTDTVYASTVTGVTQFSEGTQATGGTIINVARHGADLEFSTQVNTGTIAARSDIGTLQTQNIWIDGGVVASTLAEASNNANGGIVTQLENQAGQLDLATQVTTGEIQPGSDFREGANIGTLETARIVASTYARADADANTSRLDENRQSAEVATGGTVETVNSTGESITLSTTASTGAIADSANIGTIQLQEIEAPTSAQGIANGSIAAEPDGGSAIATGGNALDIRSTGGAIALSTQVSTGDVTAASNIGTLETNDLNGSVDAFADGAALSDNPGGNTTGGKADAIADGGTISLSTAVSAGVSDRQSDIGTIRHDAYLSADFSPSSSIDASARALADASAEGQGDRTGQTEFTANGGDITLTAAGAIQLGEDSILNGSAGIFSLERSREITDSAIDIDLSSTQIQGGNISLTANNAILLDEINAETNSEFRIERFSGIGTPEVEIEIEIETIIADVLASTAGNLSVNSTDSITLRDGVSVSVEATGGEGSAGTMNFNAQSLILGEDSRITSQANEGQGGDIVLTIQDNVALRNNAEISSSAGDGTAGNINLTASTLTLADSSRLASEVTSSGRGGNITVNLQENAQLANNAQISSSAAGTGIAGNVDLTAANLTLADQSRLTSEAVSGQGGNISLTIQDDVQLQQNTQISSQSDDGTAGNIDVSTGTLTLGNQSRLTSATNSGTGGNITLAVQDTTQLQNDAQISSAADSGTAGTISLSTSTLTLNEQSSLTSATTSGQGGNITITSQTAIQLDPNTRITSQSDNGTAGNIEVSTANLTLGNQSRLTSGTNSGEGGDIRLAIANTTQLQPNSEISSASTSGQAGNITLSTSDLIVGDDSSLTSATISGQGGNITIDGQGNVQLQNRAAVSSQSEEGRAGNINVSSANLSLGEQSRLTSETTSGQGGTITVTSQGTVDLQLNAEISSASLSGQAGNIALFITDLLQESNSRLTSETTSGQGGSIAIASQGIVELQPNATISSQSNDGTAGSIGVSAANMALGNQSRLTSGTDSGEGGDISLAIATATQLQPNAEISSASTTGQAGNIALSTSDLVLSDDSRLTSATTTGQGGNITINGQGDVQLQNRAAVSSQSEEGRAGNIDVSSANLTLGNQSRLTSETTSGQGGSIAIASQGIVELQPNATISSQSEDGVAGAIEVSANTLTLGADSRLTSATTSGEGGAITVNTQNTTQLQRNASISSQSESGIAGPITLSIGNLILGNQSSLTSATTSGRGGRLTLDSQETARLRSNATISSRSDDGRAGPIQVTAPTLILGQNSRLSSGTLSGQGGNIRVTSQERLQLADQANISSSASETGVAGNINLSVASLNLAEDSRIASEANASDRPSDVIFSRSTSSRDSNSTQARQTTEEQSQGGNIRIVSQDEILLQTNAEISSRSGDGRAGNITVVSPVLILDENSRLASGTESGEGGTIRLTVGERILLQPNASISSSSVGSGIAGNIEITAPLMVLAEESRITSETASGTGGDLIFSIPELLQLQTRANISSRAGDGSAGDIEITSRAVELGDRARLTSETNSGDGGNITLSLQDALEMNAGSQITTSAGTTGSGGDGGNIFLTVENGYILATTANSNTDITANAFDGSGGQIVITTPGLLQVLQDRPGFVEQALQGSTVDADSEAILRAIFGFSIRSREDLTTLLGTTNPDELDPAALSSNDITAISQNNPELSGEVIFQTPDLDLSEDQTDLPTVFAAPEVVRSCQERYTQSLSQFIISGRGGLPTSPTTALGSVILWQDLLPIDSNENAQDSEQSKHPQAEQSYHHETVHIEDAPLVSQSVFEDQELTVVADGIVVLVGDRHDRLLLDDALSSVCDNS
ncbi:MAG: filamentous hemagglutinin N-terminal domain-containing protein [Cyanobacteria bacterium P01_F01_bin.150]